MHIYFLTKGSPMARLLLPLVPALLSLLVVSSSPALPSSQLTVPIRLPSPGGQQVLSFQLSAFGRDFVLHLVPDASFLAPGLKIQYVRKGQGRLSGARDVPAGLRSCFYSGKVNQQRDSLAAVSLCRGIRGSFLLDGEEYLIQPQGPGQDERISIRPRPHLVLKGGHRRLSPSTWARGPQQSEAQEGGAGEKKISRERDAGNVDRGMILGQSDPKVPQPRRRRFVSEARFVETLLVADPSMVSFYGEDLKNHILTLMSVASRIYKHPSLKNSVSLVVVKVMVVEDEEVGPEVSENGGLTLRNFCNWQKTFNPPSDRHPEHYDTAILLTRQDFCGHQSCDTLGVADIGTMCDPNRSCSVIEDDGLQAAYTLAHELGHVLSMPHDDSKICERLFGHLGKHHMMAPLFIQLNKTLPWSPCSAMYITDFLDSGHGDCLLDAPATPIPLPADLPGQYGMYDLNRQCQQVFGGEFQHCPNTTEEDICSQLWCRIEGELLCHTKNGSLPWADGTSCGTHKLCWDGVCLAQEEVVRPKVIVNGNWGAWSPWGECSRTCGGGVHFSYRECNNPEPQNGGKYCEGQRVKYQSCNFEECLPRGKSFREQQCEKYNSYNYTDLDGNLLEWIPKYSGISPRDRCKLVCRARGRSEFKVFESKVIDGMLCGPESLSICVQGQCVKAGCDHVIGSSTKLDKCGECGGNSSSCRKISGSLNKSKYGYNDIVTIPAGATNIDIKQRSHRGIKPDGNYLALKTMNGRYLLNGDFAVSAMEQDILVKGTILKYSGSLTTLERIQSFQQLPEPMTVQLLTVSSEIFPPKVKYTFFIPKDVTFSKQKSKEKKSANVIKPMVTSQWVLGDWSACSKSCGSGWQRRTVECRDVEGKASVACTRELKPEDIKPCGDLPCPLWQMGSWSPCSQTCGSGLQTQSPLCIDYAGKTIEPEKCNLSKKPQPVTVTCVVLEC
ncbi:A disintegrin and metalloproteinase with thrombospondin motifs 8 [Microcaecilia unicolor]|uniref:A disintegrin and metalloproteinase with thrombospondin motifs 8 n=1 Tax=Microcaecilia unicolor TaxID=1415580 RepID=A0A6P7ZD25_9AMPH|nr:A disintegrin and metalloproteinase with thrombospondin motifs 8 [Microcaecilia unicolor]